MTRQDLIRYVAETYGTDPEYPFPRDNVSCVFRHSGSRKWFALLMQVPLKTLGLRGEGAADILNIKCDPVLIGSLRGKPGFLPAYHMNKDKWITLMLGDIPDQEEITGLLALSYDLTAHKSKLPKKKYTDKDAGGAS